MSGYQTTRIDLFRPTGRKQQAAEGEQAALSSAMRKVSAAGLSMPQSPKVKRAVATNGHARSTLASHHHHTNGGSAAVWNFEWKMRVVAELVGF